LNLKDGVKVYDLESTPELAGLKQRLAAFDAGQVSDKGQVRELMNLCREAGKEAYELSRLKPVGSIEGAQITVGARDFVLLVVE
jgi:hypothetical protein